MGKKGGAEELLRSFSKVEEAEIRTNCVGEGQVGQSNWLPGIITKRHSSVSYEVKVGGTVVHRHIDHLCPRTSKEETDESLDDCKNKDSKREEKETADDLSNGMQLEKKEDEISGGHYSSDEVEHEKVMDDHQAKDEQQVQAPMVMKQGLTDTRRYPSRKHRSPIRFRDEYGYQ